MSRERRASWVRIGVVVLTTLFISTLHYVVPASSLRWHYIFQRLFYLPVVYAGLHFGWGGGLAAAVFAGLTYLPHITANWSVLPQYAINQYVEIIVLCSAGILTGVLVDRERKQKRASQEAAERVSRIYEELQQNFERMKRAERLYALGQLSAGLAHEIRNPLASIAGAVGILRRNPGSERKQTECLEIIDKECQRLNRLLTNFLEFARPRAPRYQRGELAPVLDSVIDLAAHAIDRDSITLHRQIAADLAPIECDPEQLKQVLLNLIINSVQAMQEGGQITLAARIQDSKLLIQVQDQGRGIDPANMDRIFDPFFTTKESGTGLGLSVAHQIVVQLGGMITAQKNPGRGMTFSVWLPTGPGRVL